MTIIPNFNHEYNFNGLDTYQYTIGSSGVHYASVKLNDITGGSGISVVINRNGSPVATATSLSATDNTKGTELNLIVLINAASSDVITVVVTSSAVSDTGINQIKGFINIHQGVS